MILISFNKYNDEINNFIEDSNDIYKGYCKNIPEENGNINNSCPKAMKYLKNLEDHGHDDYSANGCKYLSYWIHYYVFNKQNVNGKSFEFCQRLLKEYEEFDNDHFCMYYIEEKNKLPYEILEKLIDPYEKFYSGNAQGKKCDCVCAKECAILYNKNRNICLESKDNDFCNELEKFKKKYDENMLLISECIDAPKSLPSAKEFDVSLIIITPISLIVLISFVLFILYKKYSRIKRKKNIYKHIEHQTNQLLHEKMCNIDSYSIKYQMKYH
ncbi:PIR protein [Plasmodium vivax]|uniref:VIR protein n=1 Tax=Plasmodium vivax TaxID=5855 RepID=A0A565A498_PLAVI|nr:PIR protein [Plasmodium vivax]